MQLLPLRKTSQRAESRSCRAGHPNDGRRGSRSGRRLRRISGHERRIGRAAQPRIGPGKPRPGERQGRQPYGHGPSSGSIVELNAKVGATVTGGMIMGESDTSGGKQCMQIADLSKMKVTVQVGEKDIAKDRRWAERQRHVSRVSRYREPGNRHRHRLGGNSDADNGGGSVTFNVDILIEAPDERLKPGMTAEVSVVT